uniref:DNA topoisomerase n=1 Tax=Sus scrofa TaxID=9823 RepID=A0A8D1UED5_PIG
MCGLCCPSGTWAEGVAQAECERVLYGCQHLEGDRGVPALLGEPGAPCPPRTLSAPPPPAGMGPQHAMQTAERLYTQGYISYPRTETTHYPESFDLKGPLRQQANHPYWADTVKQLLAEGINRPRKGHDAGDHPPITPMRSATEAELGGEAWRLYEYITRHFIATVSHDCRYLQSTISFRIGPERFTCTGKTVISPGFTEIMPWQSVPLEESLPTCQKGDTFAVGEVKMLEKQTSPPDYLTEAELITLMEKHGIGWSGPRLPTQDGGPICSHLSGAGRPPLLSLHLRSGPAAELPPWVLLRPRAALAQGACDSPVGSSPHG